MVIPTSGGENELVSWLLGEIKNGNRLRFKAITYHETISMVENGVASVKSKSHLSNVPFTEVLATAKSNLLETGELSTELIAKLIKFQILIWKSETVKETSSSTPKSDRIKSPKASTSSGMEPSRLNRLKYRAGEGPPVEVISDEPFCGPSLYVLLFGFHDANLISALEAVNLPLDTMIKVQLTWEKSADQETSIEDFKPFQLPGMVEAETSLNETLHQFWKKLKHVFVNAEPTSQLHDVIFQDLQILGLDVPSIMCSADIQNSFRASLFTNLAKLMYKIQDLKRQYLNWLDHINFVHVPSFEDQLEEFSQKIRCELGLTSEEKILAQAQLLLPDTQHYASLLDNLPNECVSVPIVLHCMIEQVVETVKHESRPLSELMIKEERETLSTRLEKIFDKCMSNVSPPMQYLPPVNTYSPLLIYYGDEIRIRMHHVSGRSFDLEAISNALVKTHPILKAVMELPKISNQQRSAQLARYQNLLSLFRSEVMTVAEIDWVLKLLTFESMALQTSDMHGNINKEFQAPIPWDDPFTLNSPEVSEDRNFPIVNNFTKGGTTICCASDSKCRLFSYTSLKLCNDSKDLIQCECMMRKREMRSSCSKSSKFSNKSIITNSRCYQCSKGCPSVSANASIASLQFTFLRNLQDYNYIEFYPRDVLQQVLTEALNVHHCVDIVYHKREPCHLLVLHNPYNTQKHCCMLWNTIINTNVYMRNFQLHVLALISDWIRKQEALYENYRQDSSGKRSTGDSFREVDTTSDFSLAKLMGDPEWVPQSIVNSLKRQHHVGEGSSTPDGLMSFDQAEFLKLKLKLKDTNEEKSKNKTESEWKRPRNESMFSIEAFRRYSRVADPTKEEDELFQGYEVGNLILHISGSTNYLYPGCRSQICVEKYVYVEGRQRVKITVYDQGNYIYVHAPIVERGARWPDNIEVVLSDGISVHAKRELPEGQLSQHSGTFDSSCARSEDSNESEKSDGSMASRSLLQGVDETSTFSSDQSSEIEAPLCLTFSLPNNLIVQIKADSENDTFLVRQFFGCVELCDEMCRTVTINGNVIRTLRKNRTEILQPDGSVLKTDWSLFTEESVSNQDTHSSRESVVSFKDDTTLVSSVSRVSLFIEERDVGEELDIGTTATGPPWTVLTPTGRQFDVQTGVWTLMERDYLLAYRAIDPGTKEEYQAREDGLHIVHKLNRHYIAHHYEGTRITTYFKQGQGEQVDTIRVEKPPFVAVTTNPELGTFNVQLSQNFSLLVNPNGTCVIHEKNGTQFAYHTDGSLLFTPDCRHCENSAKGLPFTTFVVYPYKETMFESYDHMGRHFSVKSNGVITVAGAAAEASSEENDPLNRRYFIAYPDGSGSELVDEKRMEEILNMSVENPLCQIDSNTLPNNTSVDGIQIFSPIAKTYLDTWRTNYEMDSIVPSGLTSKDLQPILPFGDRGGRHTFGRGVGNGLHVKPVGNPNPATARCFDPPQVWQLRNFLKFRKMTPELREVFQTRITELNKEIRQLEEQKQRAHAVDFRANTEQQLSASLLSLAKATGLPRNKSGKGIKSNPAGAEKTSTKTKAQFKNKMSKVGCLYGLCSEIRLNHNRLLIYRTTDCLPPFFKCQLGREALLRIKEKPATNIRTKHLVVEEKTPPLLKGAPLRKPNTPQSTKKRDIYKRDGAKVPPLAMPGWAVSIQGVSPKRGRPNI
uniref:Uncharacterized protein n=1 Tax=Strigamia maritima TaxID=126957 RepID=T1IGR5_STRMM